MADHQLCLMSLPSADMCSTCPPLVVQPSSSVPLALLVCVPPLPFPDGLVLFPCLMPPAPPCVPCRTTASCHFSLPGVTVPVP